MKGNNLIPLMIGLAVIAVLVAPSLFTGGSALLGNLGDFIRGDADRDFSGSLGLGMTIEFADGTVKEYSAEDSGIVPMTVYLEPGLEVITAIIWELQVNVDWYGTLTSCYAVGSFDIIGQLGSNPEVTLKRADFSYTSGEFMPAQARWTTVDSIRLEDTEIESAFAMGSVSLTCYGDVTFDFTWDDGETDRWSGGSDSTVHVLVETSGISAISVTMGNTPVY